MVLVEGLGGAVDRVARGAEGNQVAQFVLRGGGHFGHGDGGGLGGVGNQHAGAAGDRHHPEGAADGVDAPRGEVGDVEHFLGGAGADDAVFGEHRVGDGVIAGDGGGVGGGGLGAEAGAADFHQHHRLAGGAGGGERNGEAFGFADALGIGGDDVGAVMLGEPADDVPDGDVALVAGGDADRDADAAVAGGGVDMGAVGAGLAGDADAAGYRPTGFDRGGEGRVIADGGVE